MAEQPSQPAIDPKSRQGWLDSFVQTTLSSLVSKILAAVTIIGTAATLLTFVLTPTIDQPVRIFGLVASSAVLIIIVAVYGFRSIYLLSGKVNQLSLELDNSWTQVRDLNTEKQEWASNAETPSRATRIAAAVYGIIYNSQSVHCRLMQDGGFSVSNELEMTSLVSGLRSVEQELVAPHSPVDLEHALELQVTEPDDKTILLAADIVKNAHDRVFWELKATPEFKKGRKVKFSYTEKLPAGSFAMTKDEMETRDLAWEYWFLHIRRPTVKLAMQITLPAHFFPEKWEYDVWYGWRGQATHMEELHRVSLQDSFRTDLNKKEEMLTISLSVTDPIQGLFYCIKWLPPKG